MEGRNHNPGDRIGSSANDFTNPASQLAERTNAPEGDSVSGLLEGKVAPLL